MYPPQIEHSPLVNIIDKKIETPQGQLIVRMYEAVNKDSIMPALLWIHGGGYVLGSPVVDDPLCEEFVLNAKCTVFSVDYRLAPKHPYPAAIEDCYAALKWITESAETLQIDPDRIAIAGASAGGGLTAALALLARDRGGPKIMFQMPLYPMIDDRNITPSSYEITNQNFPKAWTREQNRIAWDMYLGETATKEIPAYAAPARARDLTGLPPAYTCIGVLDLFRDETIEYVTRLAQADVPVEFHLYPGCFHGFECVYNDTEISRQARMEYINALAQAFHS